MISILSKGIPILNSVFNSTIEFSRYVHLESNSANNVS